jgi:hypothetical protein
MGHPDQHDQARGGQGSDDFTADLNPGLTGPLDYSPHE